MRLHAKRSALATFKRSRTRFQSHKQQAPFAREKTLRDDSWRDARFRELLRATGDDGHAETPPQSPSRMNPPPRWGPEEGSKARRAHASFAQTFASAHPRSRTPTRTGPSLGAVYGAEVAAQLLDDWDDDEALVDAATTPTDRDLAHALLDCLSLFGLEFEAQACGFSVRHGGRRLVDRSGAYILIEDPLEPSNNVGRSSYNVDVALELFAAKYDEIRDALLKLPAPSTRRTGTSPTPLDKQRKARDAAFLDALFASPTDRSHADRAHRLKDRGQSPPPLPPGSPELWPRSPGPPTTPRRPSPTRRSSPPPPPP